MIKRVFGALPTVDIGQGTTLVSIDAGAPLGVMWVVYTDTTPTVDDVRAFVLPKVVEKLDAFGGKALAALTIRSSSSWAGLPNNQKKTVSDIIDAEAAKFVAVLQ